MFHHAGTLQSLRYHKIKESHTEFPPASSQLCGIDVAHNRKRIFCGIDVARILQRIFCGIDVDRNLISMLFHLDNHKIDEE